MGSGDCRGRISEKHTLSIFLTSAIARPRMNRRVYIAALLYDLRNHIKSLEGLTSTWVFWLKTISRLNDV